MQAVIEEGQPGRSVVTLQSHPVVSKQEEEEAVRRRAREVALISTCTLSTA